MSGSFTNAPDVITMAIVHDLNLAARFADHLILLNDARVAAAGTPGEVLTEDNISKVFGVRPTFIPTPIPRPT